MKKRLHLTLALVLVLLGGAAAWGQETRTLRLVPFSMFNVCCDETEGLGEGPSKVRASSSSSARA